MEELILTLPLIKKKLFGTYKVITLMAIGLGQVQVRFAQLKNMNIMKLLHISLMLLPKVIVICQFNHIL